MRNPAIVLAAALALTGCCSTEIVAPGMEGRELKSAAHLRVWRHHDNIKSPSGREVHLRVVVLDGVYIPLGSGTTTLLIAPGRHQLAGEFEDCAHWPPSWFRDVAAQFVNQTPAELTFEAGRSYDLTCLSSFNSGPWVVLQLAEK